MNRVKQIIDQLNDLRKELDSYRPISNDRMHRIMQKLRLEWNFNSNSMEGNTLTRQETKQLIYYGITAKGKPLRDHIEMKGHDKALKDLEGMVGKDVKLTESLIKRFHRMILEDSESLDEKNVEINPGEWKKHHNYLYTPTNEKVEFAPPDEVPNLMSNLINWTNNHLYQDELNRHSKKKYTEHPLVVAAIFHKRFIDIHPFGDGNGRMGRILMNLILMQNGFMPAIVPLDSRDTYYLALNASSMEDMNPLIEYVGDNLIESMKLAIEGAKGNPVEELQDWEKQLEVMRQKVVGENKKMENQHWSLENQQRIIETMLFPLLDALEPKFKQLQEALFEEGYWFVPDIGSVNKKAVLRTTLDVKKCIKAKHNRSNSHIILGLVYSFQRFIHQKQKFNTLFLYELVFHEEEYVINVMVGKELLLTKLIPTMNQFSTLLFENNPSINLIYKQQNAYNKQLNQQEIEAFSDEIMTNLMQYIQKQQQEE